MIYFFIYFRFVIIFYLNNRKSYIFQHKSEKITSTKVLLAVIKNSTHWLIVTILMIFLFLIGFIISFLTLYFEPGFKFFYFTITVMAIALSGILFFFFIDILKNVSFKKCDFLGI